MHSWQQERRTLAQWFHETVRPAGEPKLCAYCDGELCLTSPETIDHFMPECLAPERALEWQNLLPACAECNKCKRDRCPWGIARPDEHPVDDWFDFDPDSGELYPRPELDRNTRYRVRRTLWMFQLNSADRCLARSRHFFLSVRACLADPTALESLRRNGPYRFVVDAMVSRLPTLGAATIGRQTPENCWLLRHGR